MPTLVLINGAPASGKSTLARLLAVDRNLTLVLDIDTIRGLLTRWEDDPTTAEYDNLIWPHCDALIWPHSRVCGLARRASLTAAV